MELLCKKHIFLMAAFLVQCRSHSVKEALEDTNRGVSGIRSFVRGTVGGILGNFHLNIHGQGNSGEYRPRRPGGILGGILHQHRPPVERPGYGQPSYIGNHGFNHQQQGAYGNQGNTMNQQPSYGSNEGYGQNSYGNGGYGHNHNQQNIANTGYNKTPVSDYHDESEETTHSNNGYGENNQNKKQQNSEFDKKPNRYGGSVETESTSNGYAGNGYEQNQNTHISRNPGFHTNSPDNNSGSYGQAQGNVPNNYAYNQNQNAGHYGGNNGYEQTTESNSGYNVRPVTDSTQNLGFNKPVNNGYEPSQEPLIFGNNQNPQTQGNYAGNDQSGKFETSKPDSHVGYGSLNTNTNKPQTIIPNREDSNQIWPNLTSEPEKDSAQEIGEDTSKNTGKDDLPNFVPLTGNQYQYGGSHIKVDPNISQNEDEFNIDIRIKP